MRLVFHLFTAALEVRDPRPGSPGITEAHKCEGHDLPPTLTCFLALILAYPSEGSGENPVVTGGFSPLWFLSLFSLLPVSLFSLLPIYCFSHFSI